MKLLKQFGAKVTSELSGAYSRSKQWDGEKFVNQSETEVNFTWHTLPSIIKDQYKNGSQKSPKEPIPVLPFNPDTWQQKATLPKFAWYGHSALLLQIKGKNLLIDPMLSDDTTPIAPMTNRRFSKNILDFIDQFPPIDAVLITHDHYDHLDYDSIQKLKPKVDTFFVALGLARHLIAWGVPAEQITEFDWWDMLNFEGIDITFTPSRHFSGRGLTDRAKCLWGGWVFQSEAHQIYWSGDGGYDDHFREIGAHFGPFDWAFMECGQYNDNWKAIHMQPEEALKASLEVNAKCAIPVHWAGFALAFHPWKEPAERFLAEAKKQGQKVTLPQIGQVVTLGEEPIENDWFTGLD